MTNDVSEIPLSFNQRLEAANTAWQGFIHLQEQVDDTATIPRDLSALSAFSRFLHELIPNGEIRGQLLRELEPDIRHAAAFKQGELQ